MTEAMNQNIVHYQIDGDVAQILMNNPPVNALGHALCAGLIEALERAISDVAVKAIVIAGAGKVFSGGADITEFGKPPKSPGLPDVCAMCESSAKPVIAAIEGFAFGGGLELPLACHARVSTPSAKIGLPEVKLGILPGAGGTQRLPRIIGAKAALDVIVTGNPVAATKAHKTGVIDAIIDGDLLAGATVYARKLASEGAPVAVRDRNDKIAADRADLAGFDAHAEKLLKKTRGLIAPIGCVKAVRLALDTPMDEGLAAESAIFRELVASVESQAQRHIFFAERQAGRVDGVSRDTPRLDIKKVGIIGAGTMGGGIAMSFANGGFPVTVLEMQQEAIDRGFAVMARNYDTSVKRGSISQEERDARFGRLTSTLDYNDLSDCDLIIEAVFETMSVKQQVFEKLDTVAKPGAILASNTSYLDVNEIAGFTKRPGDVLGMHFFSPANVMKLLEIVRGEKTQPDVLATALWAGKVISKVPVVVGVCHGFVGNRMLSARSEELEALLLEGALPADVDKAFLDFGFPMGPFQMGDLAGLDIGYRTRQALGTTAAIADALCEKGRYGQKTSSGYYNYPEGTRQGEVDPEVTKLIEGKARELGFKRRDISKQEIIERTLYPMVNEGAKILAEGIAARASDIDVVWVYGYGFPVGKGGPMFWADQEGIEKIAERLTYWHGETGNEIFEPAGLFAADRKAASFSELDSAKGKRS